MTDLKTIEKDYEAAQAKLAKLAEDLKQARIAKLRNLPTEVGLPTIDALVLELVALASARLRKRIVPVLSEDAPAGKPRKGKTRKRAVVNEEKRKAIIKALESKTQTAKQIAAEFKVSTGTVNNIKKDAGLVEKRA